MDQPSKLSLVAKYVAEDRLLLASVFAAILVAVTLSAGAPVYLRSLEQLSFETALRRLPEKAVQVHVLAPNTVLASAALEGADSALAEALNGTISGAYSGHAKYLRGARQLVGHPEHPIPDQGAADITVTRGFLHHLSDLESHVRVLEGRMATDLVVRTPEGPELEAVVSEEVGDGFEVQVGDVMRLRPSVEAQNEVLVRIVGVIEVGDPDSEYWRFAGVYMETPVLELNLPSGLEDVVPEGVEIPEVHMLPMFATEWAMIEAVSTAYPGSLVKPNWFILLDKEQMARWPVADAERRMADFRDSIIAAMPGSAVTASGAKNLIDDLRRRSFLTQVPMLVLMLLTVITVLFFMVMMVSYIVSSRESDASLLRTRGAGIVEVLRLYALEGAVMVAAAAIAGPFLALGAVALSGRLPYFGDITQGSLLTVRFDHWPFALAAGAALVCLAILVGPGTAGARTGLLVHKLRSSRPPTVPFFHRYHLDVALLVLGALVFWELEARGNVASGGLFEAAEINETLLAAPVLLLVVVALLFMRLFPLLIRFVSGESPGLVHLLAFLSAAALAAGAAARGILGDGGSDWPVHSSLALLAGLAYWATLRANGTYARVLGLVAQAAPAAALLVLRPPDAADPLTVPTIGLAALVPAQLLFDLFQIVVRRLPVWLSLGLVRMARSPLQYSWLILLLVLATGLAIFATTVGGTLETSHTHRALYESGSDLRVAGFTSHRAGGLQGLLARYLSTPGIENIALGYRSTGTIGPVQFELLGLEPDRLGGDMLWYRSDFSELPIDGVLSQLGADQRLPRLTLPEGSTSISAWIKPIAHHPQAELWLAVHDHVAFPSQLKLGAMTGNDWQLMTAEIPEHVTPPITLLALQIVEPSFLYGLETPGALLVDDIHATTTDGSTHVLEDFEGGLNWVPIIAADISSDRFAITADDARVGRQSGALVFGSDTDQGYRGFYSNPNPGAMPVVASTALLEATGAQVGDAFVARISGRRMPVVITGAVDYFPTLDPDGGRFLLTDMDSVLRHLNVLGSAHRFQPNELFVMTADPAHGEVRAEVDEIVGRDGVVVDGVADLEELRLDPLVTAGWRPMVLLSPPVAVLVSALGYLAYLLLLSRRSGGEMGMLRTIGVSRGQLMGLLTFENVMIAGVGIGLGSWAGFQASAMMVTPLVVTETGRAVVPPFHLLTNWALMGPTYAALALVLAAALFILARSIWRIHLGSITRLEAN